MTYVNKYYTISTMKENYEEKLKDIWLIVKLLEENRLQKLALAKHLGVKKQSVGYWETSDNGMPKQYILPTIEFFAVYGVDLTLEQFFGLD